MTMNRCTVELDELAHDHATSELTDNDVQELADYLLDQISQGNPRNSKTIKHAYACIREQVLEELESDSTIDIVYSSIVSPALTSNAIYEEVKYQAFKYVEDNYNELSWLINND